jgi:Chalcone isomerase-like
MKPSSTPHAPVGGAVAGLGSTGVRRLGALGLTLLFLLQLSLLAALNAPPVLDEDDTRFELVGQGAFRWKRLIHAYDASLHAGKDSPPATLLTGAPIRLEIHYRREFSAADIVSGGDALLRRNVSAEALKSLQDRLAKLNRAYVDVKPGDRYTLTFVPGKGTTLRLNGNPLVTVEGADFAAAYFRIWLGEDPISPQLRDLLLGKGRPATPNP